MLELRIAFLPYCVQEVKPGWYVVLNRDYKPLGAPLDYRADYEQFMVKIPALTPAKAKQLSFKNSSDRAMIMLYNDGLIPTDSAENAVAYFKRLDILSKLKIADSAGKYNTESTHKFPKFEQRLKETVRHVFN